tara:strand:- start:153 stop:449 length:297 start_codon:yes stop_codon:yes gene_type:complete
MELKQDTTITMESRLDKIEDKIDKLTDTMVSMARAEEKITALRTDQNKMYERINRLSVKLDEIQFKVDENARTVNLVNKLFWVAIVAAAGAVASHMWM